MRGSIAQWTGVAVTAIVVLGTDMDVLYAVPLGIMAGALATFFVEFAEARLKARNAQAASAGMLLRESSNSTKVG